MTVVTKLGIKLQQYLKLGRAISLVWQCSKTWTIISSVILIIQGIFPLLSLYLMKLVIDAVTTGISAPDKAVGFRRVAILIALATAVALLNNILSSIAKLVNEAQSQLVINYMADLIHAKSIEVDLEYYENSQYYDTFHRAQSEASSRPSRVLKGLVKLGQNGVSLVAITGLLLSLHWCVFAVLIIAVLPRIIVRFKYANEMYCWQRQKTLAERRANYYHWLITQERHAKEIRLFNLGQLFASRFHNVRQQLYREKLKISTRHSLKQLITQISATFADFGVYGFIAYRTVQGELTLGDLVMYHQAFKRLQSSFQSILGSIVDLYSDNLYLTNLYEFLDLKPKIVDPLCPTSVPRPMQKGISFNHVSFQYPGSTRQALKDINLILRPGEIIALVGENGSGKTTLIKLLCRLYNPTNGYITLDNIDICQFKLSELRREISVIFQDYARYQLTARENIWLGNIDCSSPKSANIITAARYAGADEMITRLPQSYETLLGKWFDGSEELSIGQWQKISLARAFLRKSQLIVLDEPTSALDPKAEDQVFKKFRQLLQGIQGQAAILISHRLSTVKMADRIYVLEKGNIIESGSHQELMQIGKTYAHLFETQAQNYR